MSSRRKQKERREAFSDMNETSSMQEATDEIFHPGNDENARPKELHTGRMTARPIALNEMRPHRAQPRRPIPPDILDDWDGDPDEIEDILRRFHEQAEAEYGEAIDVAAVLQGRTALAIPDERDERYAKMPVFVRYANLVLLAQNILSDGLTNPITVSQARYGYQIETGERRWWAFQILARYVSQKEWGKIPAREVEYDPFRQASENNARSDLNAIETARQVALLIMALLNDKFEYTPIDDMVLPGENDRRFYAQVANGYVHEVPKALQGQIQKAVKGLSWSRINQYRSLLALVGNDVVDDAIWKAADKYGWADRAIRELVIPRGWDDKHKKEYVSSLERTVQNYDWDYEDLIRVRNSMAERINMLILQEEQKKNLTPQPPLQSIREGEQTPVDKSQWASYAWVGKEAWVGRNKVFVTRCTTPDSVVVEWVKDGEKQTLTLPVTSLYSEAPPGLEEFGGSDNADNPKADATQVYQDKNGVVIEEGDTVKTRRGVEAVVIGFNGRYVNVSSGNPYLPVGHYPDTLEVTAKAKSSDTQEDVESWQGKIVQTVVGAVAKVVEDNGAEVRIQFPPGHFAKQRKEYLTELPESEWVAAVNRHLAQTPQQGQSVPEKSDYPAQGETSASQLVGKPMLYKEQPTIVIADAGNGEMLIQLGKERAVVPIGELSFHPETDDDDDDEVNGTRQGLVLASDDVMRRYLEPYRMLSVVLNNEHATSAIEWLMNLTYERTNQKQLEAAMNHVIDHVEDINKTVEAIIFEQFRLKLEAMGDV